MRTSALLLVTVCLLGGWVPPAAAQDTWMPIVVTSPGGTLNAPAAVAASRVPAIVDPRFFPSPRAPAARPARNPQQGAWSPIVTGALPEPRDGAPGVMPAQGDPQQKAPPSAGPTPLRPVIVGQTAAAGAPKTPEAGAKSKDAPGGDETAAGSEGTFFKKPSPIDSLPPNADAAQQYCFNTADTAADARFAWQAKKIQEMEAELDKRAHQLEAKTEEYKTWLNRRDEFSRKAHEKLVGFYSRMRPDAAAVQLATIDEQTAAAVMTKLETKVASQIMGEMDPERAAKIATIISGAAKISASVKRAPAPAETQPPDAASQAPEPAPAPEQPRS
jgi:flagellar motility protein MotE (MotC chaperone)